MIYEFQATQDLHGWGKPWAPGENDNKLDPVIYTGLSYNPTVGNTYNMSVASDKNQFETSDNINYLLHPVSNSSFYTLLFELEPDTQYHASMKISSSTDYVRISYGYMDEEYKVLGNTNQAPSAPYTLDINLNPPEDTKYFYILISNGAGGAMTITVNSPLINEGSEAADYSPYANICPPEGFNIWDPTNQEYIQVYAGYVNANTRELYLRPVYQEYAGEELVGPWMSDIDPYEEDTTPTEGAFVIDFGGELTSFEITPFMLQTLLDSLGIRQHFTDGAGLLNSLMDQAQGRVRSEEELLHLSRPLKVIAIGDQLPAGLTFKPISKDVLPGLPGKFIR